MVGKPESQVLLHLLLLEPNLFYLGVNVVLMIKIVGKRTIDLRGGELWEVSQDVFRRQSSSVMNHH